MCWGQWQKAGERVFSLSWPCFTLEHSTSKSSRVMNYNEQYQVQIKIREVGWEGVGGSVARGKVRCKQVANLELTFRWSLGIVHSGPVFSGEEGKLPQVKFPVAGCLKACDCRESRQIKCNSVESTHRKTCSDSTWSNITLRWSRSHCMHPSVQAQVVQEVARQASNTTTSSGNQHSSLWDLPTVICVKLQKDSGTWPNFQEKDFCSWNLNATETVQHSCN